MTLDYIRGDIYFSCDSCPETLETDTSNFHSARNVLFRNDWKAYKSGETWRHRCDTCIENAATKRKA